MAAPRRQPSRFSLRDLSFVLSVAWPKMIALSVQKQEGGGGSRSGLLWYNLGRERPEGGGRWVDWVPARASRGHGARRARGAPHRTRPEKLAES